MINVEGYKAFHGTMRITPAPLSGIPPFEVYGDWLYKPDTDCWYGCGRSFPSRLCTVADDRQEAHHDPLP